MFDLMTCFWIQLGEMVRYTQSFDASNAQPVNQLMHIFPHPEFPYELVRPKSGDIEWKIRTPIAFAPEDSEVYRQMMAKDDDKVLREL
jgi:hypothetical protein